MNGLLMLTLLGAGLLPYSVKQALALTDFRMLTGANNHTNVNTVNEKLKATNVDNLEQNTTRVNETTHVRNESAVVDLLECRTKQKCSGKCHAHVDYETYQMCRCDILCWFYGDCCLGYYEDCLQVKINDTDHTIMVASLSKLETYWQARNLRRVLWLIKLSTCSRIPNHYILAGSYFVRECGAEPETEMKFHALHQKLTWSTPGQSINFFAGISKEVLITKCRGSTERLAKQGHNLETIPVTLVSDAFQVDFYNVFCAICNGIDPADVKYWESEIVCKGVNNITKYAKDAVLNVSDSTTNHCKATTTIPKTARMCEDPSIHLTSSSGSQHHGHKNITLLSIHSMRVESTQKNSTNKLLNDTCDDSMEPRSSPVLDVAPNGNHKGRNGNHSLDDREQETPSIRKRNVPLAEFEHARFCQMYIFSFYWKSKWYKNPHCLPCASCHDGQNKPSNFWDSFVCPKNKCSCGPDLKHRNVDPHKLNEGGSGKTFTANFRVLFDFRRQTTMVAVNEDYLNLTINFCNENQTYVPLYHECREIVCPLGKHLVGSKCLANDGCSSGQGGNENKCGEHIFARPFRERLALVNTTKRITIIMRFRYILQRYIDNNEALNGDSGLGNASIEAPCKSDRLESHEPTGPGGNTTNKTSINKFFIVDINTMRSFWNGASGMRGFDDRGEAIVRLSMKVKETMLSHIIESGGLAYEFNSSSDFDNHRGDSVSMSFLSDFNEAESISFLLARLAHWGINENLTRLANENNFMFYRIEFSSQPLGTTSSTSASGRRPCNVWEELTYQKFKVYVDGNGSHAMRFQEMSTTLSETMFNVIVDLNDDDDEVGIRSANVGVCRQHVKAANCGYVYFNMSDFVIYQDSLVTTSRAQDLGDFLGALTGYERRMSSLAEFVERFEKLYGKSDVAIYRSEHFIMAYDGAFVCQNHSRNYNVTIKGNLTRIYYIMPTSLTEQIATVASLALSIVCLVIVLVVYGLVKEQRNIPGKIVMSMSGTLLWAQVIFLFSTYPRGLACQVYAAVQHALWLASFAWLAVMALNLAYVLYFQSHATSDSIFYIFSCLCWVLPFLLVGCLLAMDITGVLDIQYGTNGICWIGNAKAMMYAFGVPLFTMLFATLVCAVFVVRAIKKSVKFRHNNTLNHSGEKTQLLLCVNLSLLMGFNWVFYFLAVATDTPAMWTVFIVTNGSQGCYIFLCYVARRAILAKVRRQLNICRGAVAKSRYAQGSPTVSHKVTKTTTLSPATSLKNLHLVVNPRSSPSSSPTPSPTRFNCVIAI